MCFAASSDARPQGWDSHLPRTMEDAMTDKKSSPKLILVAAIATWLGAAANAYRIFTQSQKPDGDLFDAILMTIVFAAIAVAFTIQYRNAKRDL